MKDKDRIIKQSKYSKVYTPVSACTQKDRDTERERDRKTDTAQKTEGKTGRAYLPNIVMGTQDT